VAKQDVNLGELEIDQIVLLTANMSLRKGPVELERFDLRRNACFFTLGAFGCTCTEVLTLSSN
jgi:hypothetical protein